MVAYLRGVILDSTAHALFELGAAQHRMHQLSKGNDDLRVLIGEFVD